LVPDFNRLGMVLTAIWQYRSARYCGIVNAPAKEASNARGSWTRA
jgi:hypothetical protein